MKVVRIYRRTKPPHRKERHKSQIMLKQLALPLRRLLNLQIQWILEVLEVILLLFTFVSSSLRFVLMSCHGDDMCKLYIK